MNEINKKYIEIEKIGSGNYGKVIKAKNKVTGKYVAIKEINKSKYDDTNQCLLENIKYINSENSISIIEIIDSKDYLYIVMELCLISLEKYIEIRNKGLLIEEIKEILIQLNNVFKLIKEKNIIKRDLKLSDIFITINNINRILIKLSCYDLNIKTNEKDKNDLINAPDINEYGYIPNKSDIWNLGIIIYYLLFNEYPYKKENGFKLNNDPQKELKLSGNNQLDDLIKKMLIIDYKKRITWNDYFNHPFFKNENKLQDIKFPDINFEILNNNNFQFRCKDCYNIPLFGIMYENLKVKIESRCQKGHYNIEKLEDFYNRNSSNCFSSIECCVDNEKQQYENTFSYCPECNKFICPNHLKEHKHEETILYSKLDNYCIEHDKKLISFCKTCSINLCEDCKNNHIKHNIVEIDSIKLSKNEIEKCENNLKETEIRFKEHINKVKELYNENIKFLVNFIKIFENYKNMNLVQINLCYILINNYKEMNEKKKLNYEIIHNIKNIFNFKLTKCEIDKNFHILTRTQRYFSFMNNNFNCILEKSNNWINIDYKITKEEKDYILYKLKPLKDINLEYIDKLDEGNGYYYYGEIKNEYGDIYKHGRGIKLYINGGKDIGYFDNFMNGFAIIYYRDGSTNMGNKKNGAHDGFHLYKSSDGLIIKNNYKNGLREGFDILYYPNGDIEIKEYENNVSKGYCIKYSSNGEKYEGEVKYSNKNGIGINTTFRSQYEGEWKNDCEEGIGKLCWSNTKDKYEGEFKYKNFHGFGFYFNEDGLINYEGQYENGLYNGYGIDYYSDGNKSYDGFWKNEKSSGFGVCYLRDGFLFYIGYLKNNHRHGFGVYKDKPNLKMIGNWNDNQIGNGPYYRFNTDGSSYRGYARNGKFYGYGIYKWSDGEVYEGEWVNDQPHGYGIFKYNDGRVYKGMWEFYKKVGLGEEINPSKGIYRGEWKNNRKDGYGMEYGIGEKDFKFVYYQNGTLIKNICMK